KIVSKFRSPRNRARPGPRRSWRRSSMWPRTAARFPMLPLQKLSRTVTCPPPRTNSSTKWEPMNPAPPVTSMRGQLRSLIGRGSRNGAGRDPDAFFEYGERLRRAPLPREATRVGQSGLGELIAECAVLSEPGHRPGNLLHLRSGHEAGRAAGGLAQARGV